MIGSVGSRPVRIPRSGTGSPRVVRLPTAARTVPLPERAATLERRENHAGTQRATRIAVLFVVGIAVLFTALTLYARAAPGGTSPGAGQEVDIFGLLGAAIALAGAILALASAPRAIEVGAAETVVVGRFGRRRRFPTLGGLSVRLVRRYPSGILSDQEVDAVEVSGGTQRATYFLEEGLLKITTEDAGTGRG